MPVNPQFLVKDLKGRPIPPDWLTKRLQREFGVGLFYTNAAWAITEAWKPDDVRRQWIQKGEMQPEYAFDIAGYLPVTCAIDEAPGFIAQMLRGYTPETFKGLREAARRWNETDGEGQDAQVFETVMAAVDNKMGEFVGSAGIFGAADVTKPFELPTGPEAAPPFDFQHMPDPNQTPARVGNDMKAARAALAAKRAKVETP